MELHPILRRLQHLQSARAAAPGVADAPDGSSKAAFAAQGRVSADTLQLQVRGVGSMASPVPAEQAQRLQAASRPAKYGQGERTLLDTAVRHTGEIDAEAVTLTWSGPAREALLREVAAALGSAPLEARLHALLVYGPGQFFKPHQDTEKHDGMVGTLVLVWPSAHIGGRLVVRHQQGEFGFASQQLGATEVRWCAFYADCRHEVLPVEEGWRVAITFDLVVADSAQPAADQAPPDAALQSLLRAEFGLDDIPSLQPWVLLLDHEYTEHGLRWHLLKGPDRERVAALRAAGEPLGLSLHLALAELHQVWTADVDAGYGRRGRRPAEPQPDELIDSTLTLDHWVDAQGRVGPSRALNVQEEQLHGFSDTDDAYLVDEAYEGYMGNWGETLEYWYRRAALVIQSPVAAERSRFQLDPEAVLRELQTLARRAMTSAASGQASTAGKASPVTELAQRVSRLRDLLITDKRSREPRWLQPCADIAAALPDADAEEARNLMAGFDPADFSVGDMPALARLQQGRGAPWLQALWAGWAQRGLRDLPWSVIQPTRLEAGDPFGLSDRDGDGEGASAAVVRRDGLWPEPLPEVVAAGLAAGLAPSLMQQVAGVWALDALRAANQRRASWTPAQRREGLERVMGEAVALARAAQALPEPRDCLRPLLAHVVACPGLYPATERGPLVVAAGEAASRWPAGVFVGGLSEGSLRGGAIVALRKALARPLLEPDDHTVRDVEWTCACADCTPVTRWAESAAAQPLTLAMAEARRRHGAAGSRRRPHHRRNHPAGVSP